MSKAAIVPIAPYPNACSTFCQAVSRLTVTVFSAVLLELLDVLSVLVVSAA